MAAWVGGQQVISHSTCIKDLHLQRIIGSRLCVNSSLLGRSMGKNMKNNSSSQDNRETIASSKLRERVERQKQDRMQEWKPKVKDEERN